MIKHALFAGFFFLAGCGGGDDPKTDAAADVSQDAPGDAGAADASPAEAAPEAARDAAAE